MEDKVDLRWRTASFSGNGGGNCVEVGQGADGAILVRDTKDDTNGPVHRYTADEWRAFLAGVRAGEFDVDQSGHLL